MTEKSSRFTGLIIGLAVVVVVALGVVLYATQPWRAFTSSTIDEALPGTPATTAAAAATDTPAPAPTAAAADAGAVSSPAQPPAGDSAPVHLKQGMFTAIDHETSGEAYLTRLPDGSQIIRLENLATEDGPDLKVVVTTSDADPSQMTAAGYLNLGDLKATHGNQNYELPSDFNTDSIRSVVVWCERFSSAFGSAPLS